MSRFDDNKPKKPPTNSDDPYNINTMDAWPYFKLACATSGSMLVGRIGYFLYTRGKWKRSTEMYVLNTRVYTQFTFILTFSLPVLYGMGVWASKKMQGISTEQKRRVLPPDMEYVD